MSETFYLDVGEGHQLHVACVGNPAGAPVLFLHGGPGSGCNASHHALFDPARHYAIFLDQRGAGQSHPKGARHANTTAHLVADILRLQNHLGIARWMVVGGSWGATLALAYAEAHPSRVRALVLRAVFLGTRAELDWAFGTALATFYPGLHAAFLAHLTADECAMPIDAYWRRILHSDRDVHGPAAWIWHDVERALSNLVAPQAGLPSHDPDGPLPSTPFMEAHYFSQNCFLAEGALLAGVNRIAHIPAVLVQARYDLLCPPQTTARLAAAWPNARVVMVEAAGHAQSHAGVATALKDAIATLAVLAEP